MSTQAWQQHVYTNNHIDQNYAASYMQKKSPPPWLSLNHALPSSAPHDGYDQAITSSPYYYSSPSSCYSANGPLDYSPPLSTSTTPSSSQDWSRFAGQQDHVIHQLQLQAELQCQAQAQAQLQAERQARQVTYSHVNHFEPPTAKLQQLLDLAAFISAQYGRVAPSQVDYYANPNIATAQDRVNKDAEVGLALLSTSLRDANQKPKIKREKYKTEMCRSWEEQGHCKYENVCQFAHGHAELQSVSRHPKYKTEPCRAYFRTGTCPYAKRCIFLHHQSANPFKKGNANATSCGGGGKEEESVSRAPLLSRVGIQTATRGPSPERPLFSKVDVTASGVKYGKKRSLSDEYIKGGCYSSPMTKYEWTKVQEWQQSCMASGSAYDYNGRRIVSA